MQQQPDSHRTEPANKPSARVTLRRVGKKYAASPVAELIDISRKRALVGVSTPLQFDEPVELKIGLPSIGWECDLLATVRHIRAATDGNWLVGCQVDPPLDERIVSLLVAQIGLNRRRRPREPISLAAT